MPSRSARAFRTGARALAVAMSVVGLELLIAPQAFDGLWPWRLTPLTGRAVGAWLTSIAVALVAVSLERDWRAIRRAPGHPRHHPAPAGVLRFPDSLDSGDTRSWVYVGGLLVALIRGAVLFVSFESRFGAIKR